MPVTLAEIRDLCHPGAMDLDVIPVSLLEDLHALAAMGDDIHADICTLFSEGPEFGCTCGAPRVVRSLAELLPLPAGASQPYQPTWTPATSAA